jgi:predicted ThiF/HesA family dinucleotide-utilizing enzyme
MQEKIKNKIGYVDNKYLGINKPKGHYVYIRKVNKNGTCDVNTFTSLEDNGKFKEERVNHIKKGNIYPIPKNDANFIKWTGVRNNPIKNVKIRNIKSIGSKTIKTRHLFYIGKFMDKKK